MDYNEALKFLKSTAFMGSVPGLDRLRNMLFEMGNPQKKLKFIHVAGTNGKGSTCAMIGSVLKCAGYKVGMFSSPFLNDFREQISINGKMIDEKSVAEITSFMRYKSENVEAMPTEFELTLSLAFEYFNREKCDIVILECGMGGRGDATNIIANKEVAVITKIAVDHCSFLGSTIEEICDNKADIITPNCEVVCYPQPEGLVEIIKSKTEREVIFADFKAIKLKNEDISSQTFDYKEFENIELGLIGEHQRFNCSVVLEVIKKLIQRGYKISDRALREGLKNAFLPARLEILSKKPLFILDGGHNVDCISTVKNTISKYFKGKDIIFVVGVMADKDFKRMFDIISTISKAFVAVVPNNERALSLDKLESALLAYKKPVYAVGEVRLGVEKALEIAEEDDVIFALGSLYMAGDIRNYFKHC